MTKVPLFHHLSSSRLHLFLCLLLNSHSFSVLSSLLPASFFYMIRLQTTSASPFFPIDIHFSIYFPSFSHFPFSIFFTCHCRRLCCRRIPAQIEISYYLHQVDYCCCCYCAAHCFRDALTSTLSALYGKLLVVMGIAFPMAEVISTYIPPSFYEVSTQGDMNLTSHG